MDTTGNNVSEYVPPAQGRPGISTIWAFYEVPTLLEVPPLNKMWIPEYTDYYSSSGDPDNDLPAQMIFNRTTDMGYPIDYINYAVFDDAARIIINTLALIICIFGFLGNGVVIRLLGMSIKRNPYIIYVLNLAVADFGVLVSLFSTSLVVIAAMSHNSPSTLSLLFFFFLELFFFTYSVGQFVLAAISIDRCVAILFPLWHRCHRPPHLSTIACAVIWILSFLLSGIHLTFRLIGRFGKSPLLYQLIVNALLCTPLMLISSLTLFTKVCCKPEQRQRGKLVIVILLALLFFLIFAFPLNGFYIITYYYGPHPKLMVIGLMCACLNSSVNPVIYFLVGRRQKKGQPRASIMVALQRVFKEDEYCMQEGKPTTETHL